jgi:hypothetical protein
MYNWGRFCNVITFVFFKIRKVATETVNQKDKGQKDKQLSTKQ